MLYEIEHQGEIVKKEYITLNKEQKLIEIPVEEKHRGNFSFHYVFIKNNRTYSQSGVITVPYTNKELDIEFETFRNKLLPGQNEEWKIKIKDKKGDKVAAEMMATLYDASLDAFKPNNWYFNIYNNYYSNLYWDVNSAFGVVNAQMYGQDWNRYPSGAYKYYDQLNWFGYSNGYYGYYDDMDGDYNYRGARTYAKSSPVATGSAMPDEEENLWKEMNLAGKIKISRRNLPKVTEWIVAWLEAIRFLMLQLQQLNPETENLQVWFQEVVNKLVVEIYPMLLLEVILRRRHFSILNWKPIKMEM